MRMGAGESQLSDIELALKNVRKKKEGVKEERANRGLGLNLLAVGVRVRGGN